MSNEAKYHAVPINSGLISTRQIAKDTAMQSTLSEGDVITTFAEMANIIEGYLQNGYSVKIDGLDVIFSFGK